MSDLWPENVPKKLMVAVSGGPDSTALACLAASRLGKELEEVTLAHFHHHLRGQEADRDERFVRDLAEKLDVDYVHGDWDPESKRGLSRPDRNLQAAARKARYEFLVEAARVRKIGVIATAHHIRDLTESVLQNFARGGGTGAWRGIRDRFERTGCFIIRPVLLWGAEDLRRYLSDRRQDFRSDSTNECLDFRRNWVRRRLAPHLNQVLPSFYQQMESRWRTAKKEAHAFEDQYSKVVEGSLKRTGELIVPLKLLNGLREEALVHVLRRLLHDLSAPDRSGQWEPIRRKSFERLIGMLKHGRVGVINFAGRIRGKLTKSHIVFSQPRI